jgi:hypothetical protein
MNNFLTGFADELTKIGAFGQQTSPPDAHGGADVSNTMSKTYGLGAAAGLKGGPLKSSPARRTVAAPSPLTTPSHMVDVASKI